MILDDGGDATMYVLLGARAEAGEDVLSNPGSEEEVDPVRPDQEAHEGEPRLVRPPARRHPRRHRGDHHRRQPPLSPDGEGPAAVPGHQRQRLGHQVEVRQQVRLQGEPGRRHPPRHRRDDGRQDRRRLRLWRRRQGLGRLAAGAGARVKVTEADPICALQAAMDGFEVVTAGGRGVDRRHLRHRHRQQGRHHARPHARDEGHGDRRQHRPLRQRDPGRRR
jgi:adenosylhomocysteinase